MNNFTFCFIIPTRNRPTDIRALLANLGEQSVKPDQVIIIDSSDTPQPELQNEFPELDINYHAFDGPPSAAAQRNAGLEHVGEGVDLIGFVDDDMIFEEDALRNMLQFWKVTENNLCGAAFNWVGEDTANGRTGSKLWRIAQWLGLYRLGTGQVAPSGWHGRIRQVEKNTQVEWLMTGAVIWKAEVLKKVRFDNYFEGYSYLEDLDFSYSMSQYCNLYVVADARVHHFHHHNEHDAQWNYDFGRMEVRNRLHFVRKYNLSTWRCYLALIIRLFMTLGEALRSGDKTQLARARGNLSGLWEELFRKKNR